MESIRHIEKIPLATDEQLVHAYQQEGNQEHLAVLFLRYSDLVYGTALKYLKDADQAKDAVMNIYYELVQKLKTHDVEHFKGWLYVLTKNHCLMWLRKHKKGITIEFQPHLCNLLMTGIWMIYWRKKNNLNNWKTVSMPCRMSSEIPFACFTWKANVTMK